MNRIDVDSWFPMEPETMQIYEILRVACQYDYTLT